MATMTCTQRRAYHAKQRRLRKDRERLQHEQQRAQRFLQALEQALVDLGLSETLVAEVEWRAQAPVKLLGKIFGMMFPTLCGCRTTYELTQLRVWDKNLPGRMLRAMPKQQWIRQLPRRGQALWTRLWQQVEDKSPATQSRWQWTWVGDDSVFKKAGQQLGLVGTWYSGQAHRVRPGSDGLLLVVVMGDGQLVVPVDFVVRRPDPGGPGRPGRDQLTGRQVLRDRTWAVLQRRCRRLPAPLVVADSGFGDSALLGHVHTHQQGTLVVEGKRRDVFSLPDGRRVPGEDLRTRPDWPWRESPQVPGLRDARLTATRTTYGRVTLVLVDNPGEDRF
jgi:DDE superfamily endonuclease